MIRYTIKMQHDEKTFEALSRMQYDLFCSSNRITRTILSILLIAAGIVNFTQWWGILLAAYNQPLRLREPHGTQACGTDQK